MAGASCATVVMGGSLGGCSLLVDAEVPPPQASTYVSSGGRSPVEDPWTLPVEDRPPLFDPCSEISVEDLAAAGIEGAAEWPEATIKQKSPNVNQCGWTSESGAIAVGAHWTEPRELFSSVTESAQRLDSLHGYPTLLVKPINSESSFRCGLALKTNRGLVTTDLVASASSVTASAPCDKVQSIAARLIPALPEPSSE